MLHSSKLEDAARRCMVDADHFDPLPPGPNFGTFGYFRLSILILAGVIVALLVLSVL